MDKPRTIIVSRHAAAIEFIRSYAEDGVVYPFAHTEAIAQATPDDVRDAIVVGNLPLHLAALAAEVVAIEFAGAPPRGQEYTLADMQAAGARLVRYRVATPAQIEKSKRGTA
jgi:hypothetical protein